MKSVNPKSQATSKRASAQFIPQASLASLINGITQPPAANTQPVLPGAWCKVSVHFDSETELVQHAFAIASFMRMRHMLYFARYSDLAADRYTANYTVLLHDYPQLPDTTAVLGDRILSKIEGRRRRVMDKLTKRFLQAAKKLNIAINVGAMEMCSGSVAHAVGFDAIAGLKFAFTQFDGTTKQREFQDVLHWMYNMMGYDYTQEVGMAAFGIQRIMCVFADGLNAVRAKKQKIMPLEKKLVK